MQPHFSIIIPHYNIPDLLMRCLKSIPVSEDIQVIVVDDNSPNADTYLEKYSELSRPYLEFIRTTKGGGAGYARNVGLDNAKGKWLLFADADDLYVDNMYDIILKYVDSEADIIYFKNKSVMSIDITKPSNRCEILNYYVDQYFEFHDEKKIRANNAVPWAKMIRLELIHINKIRFDELLYSNDLYFMTSIGCYAKKIEVCKDVLYLITTRQGSLTSDFCKKEGELAIRANVCFRTTKLLNQFNMYRETTPFSWFLYELFKSDRKLFMFYFSRLCEIYPTTLSEINLYCKNKSLKLKILLSGYALLLWMKKLIS